MGHIRHALAVGTDVGALLLPLGLAGADPPPSACRRTRGTAASTTSSPRTGRPGSPGERAGIDARHLVTMGAGLSLLAALIHAWVMPEHLADLR